MEPREFLAIRQKLQKTQKEVSQVLGTSLRGVQSFEQGWRKIPAHVERQVLFLLAMKNRISRKVSPCWVIRRCALPLRKNCPAWQFRVGDLCWFVNGTLCQGKVQRWNKKMKVCRKCPVMGAHMK